ncbi:hypothetical protein [Sulfuriroseicoccus oceanibius]|uniref:Uncharacterized protein n=1 Tax=Sulfuriroseicoccus oceanibius TaxID=2707525 RepID=A0A6B3L5R9_9BACT|nr:hypothetical protein [Sulfuriroseicoccus oceanibius]QQL45747.1 hypothetical protein G3M56_003940 [Sulfuriroseicoccus oceanibius]
MPRRRPAKDRDPRRSYGRSTKNMHDWREKVDNHTYRLIQAWRETGRWFYRTCEIPKGRAANEGFPRVWTDHDPADLSVTQLEVLREKIFGKYQRRRLPWEHVEEVDALITAAKERDAQTSSDEEE